MTSNAELETAASPASGDQVQVLLVEDDDGDAVLVSQEPGIRRGLRSP